METRLEAYRIRRRRKQVFEEFRQKLFNLMPFQSKNSKDNTVLNISDDENNQTLNDSTFKESNGDNEIKLDNLKSEEVKLLFSSDDDDETDKNSIDDVPENDLLKYLLWMVYFLFWATCYAIAIELKFGIVYLLFSALFGIYFNTRTGPKKSGEISAYSVFNKDCISIDGTLKAEQFEREIRYGPGSVR